jgi:hypothetical protein
MKLEPDRKASSWEYGGSYRKRRKMLRAEVTGSIWGEVTCSSGTQKRPGA